MLTASITVYFSVLDLGYGGALVKFMAQYRAQRDARALNEIASTLFFVFVGVGVRRLRWSRWSSRSTSATSSSITPDQAQTGKWILLIIGVNVSLNFPFSVFGGVINGFQRYDLNNMVAIAHQHRRRASSTSSVLLAGYGLVALVAATTCVRVARLFRLPPQRLSDLPGAAASGCRSFRRDRLREVTGFSVYSSIIDWANKLNYQLDALVIGAFIGSAAVAVWARGRADHHRAPSGSPTS